MFFIIDVYIRTLWTVDMEVYENKELDLQGVSWTSTVECSETDCAVGCQKSAACWASAFNEVTGNCTFVDNQTVTLKNATNSSVRVKAGGT